eukprot:TRINITY_DN11443_c0_g1_i1.p1 TRINITY_DN11443_c0_g1~~TRINITY_DN11443_c0_g1_i1.p1  ORF type:complete len:476 (+),score=32.01 TRINITY_DN11443_c0_g1_i1:88-1428(+)
MFAYDAHSISDLAFGRYGVGRTQEGVRGWINGLRPQGDDPALPRPAPAPGCRRCLRGGSPRVPGRPAGAWRQPWHTVGPSAPGPSPAPEAPTPPRRVAQRSLGAQTPPEWVAARAPPQAAAGPPREPAAPRPAIAAAPAPAPAVCGAAELRAGLPLLAPAAGVQRHHGALQPVGGAPPAAGSPKARPRPPPAVWRHPETGDELLVCEHAGGGGVAVRVAGAAVRLGWVPRARLLPGSGPCPLLALDSDAGCLELPLPRVPHLRSDVQAALSAIFRSCDVAFADQPRDQATPPPLPAGAKRPCAPMTSLGATASTEGDGAPRRELGYHLITPQKVAPSPGGTTRLGQSQGPVNSILSLCNDAPSSEDSCLSAPSAQGAAQQEHYSGGRSMTPASVAGNPSPLALGVGRSALAPTPAPKKGTAGAGDSGRTRTGPSRSSTDSLTDHLA